MLTAKQGGKEKRWANIIGEENWEEGMGTGRNNACKIVPDLGQIDGWLWVWRNRKDKKREKRKEKLEILRATTL